MKVQTMLISKQCNNLKSKAMVFGLMAKFSLSMLPLVISTIYLAILLSSSMFPCQRATAENRGQTPSWQPIHSPDT